MPQCEEIEELLVVHIYGDLEERDRARVCEHLASCQKCRERVLAYQQTLCALPTDLLAPSAARHDRLVSRCQRHVETAATRTSSIWERLLGNRWVQVGAAAAVFFLLGVGVGCLVTRSLLTGLADVGASVLPVEAVSDHPLLKPLAYRPRPQTAQPTWIQSLRQREQLVGSLTGNSEAPEEEQEPAGYAEGSADQTQGGP
jgi:anti-sigma factor RsiW